MDVLSRGAACEGRMSRKKPVQKTIPHSREILWEEEKKKS
jgi:hypothetical protein